VSTQFPKCDPKMPSFHYINMPISTVYYWITQDMINESPDYQREIVWKENDQKDLIDTLLDGFPMPAINFCEESDPTLRKYECMDGKNRIQSIRLFKSNKMTSNSGKLFSELTERERNAFDSIPVSICVFNNLTQAERRDYFRRIQKGVRLSQCELIWSQSDHGMMIELKSTRNEMFDKIKLIWKTYRYIDIQLFFNIANMVQGRNAVLQSTGLTAWLDKQPNNANYSELFRKIRSVLLVLHRVITACPEIHVKMYVPFVFDMSKWIIVHNYQIPSINVITKFINGVGKLINDKGGVVESQIAIDYYNVLITGAASRQYSNKETITRFQLVDKLLSA
jgi:hypothetical protein